MAIVGLSLGCVALAGCSGSPTSAATEPSDPASTPTTTKASGGTKEAPPATHTRPAPPPPPRTRSHVAPGAPEIGPNGLGGLTLGMTFREARTAGFVRGSELSDWPCGMYDMYFRGERFGRVFISADRGVESISPGRRVRTPEGMTIGTAAARVAAAYPAFDITVLRDVRHVGILVPGNPAATYRLDFTDRDRVADIALQRTDQQCYE